jgi:hypothetical protein
LFKTQKILGGRALAADAFGKNLFEYATSAGPGYYAHRDGYNVLYGDWSTKWWGDPQQTFIYWPPFNQAALAPEYGGDTNVVTDCIWGPDIAALNSGNTAAAGSGGIWFTNSNNGAGIQWHVLDVAAGIDNSTIEYP